jgi:type IV secretion system protein VirB8
MKRDEFQQYLEESKGLERDLLEEQVRSKAVAWRVAAVSWVLLGLSLVGYVLLLPLKKVEPYVVRVDNATGAVDIVTVLRDASQTYGEVTDKYWLNKYVLNRESYDWQTLQSTYDTTVLLSAEPVQREFAALYDGDQARQEVLGDRVKYLVKVRSITPAKDTAVVRFVRTRHVEGAEEVDENLVATIGFQYVSAPMKEQDRLVNPLGFQVTSYRVDPENVGG